MKSTFATRAVAAVLIAASTGALANDVVISGNPQSPGASAEDKAAGACFDAFIKKILPNTTAHIRIVDKSSGQQIFTSDPYGQQMNVEMTATLARTHEKLASAYCTVNSEAKIARLTVRVTDAQKLAAVTVKDIRLAQSSR
jgi:hypothetical protein